MFDKRYFIFHIIFYAALTFKHSYPSLSKNTEAGQYGQPDCNPKTIDNNDDASILKQSHRLLSNRLAIISPHHSCVSAPPRGKNSVSCSRIWKKPVHAANIIKWKTDRQGRLVQSKWKILGRSRINVGRIIRKYPTTYSEKWPHLIHIYDSARESLLTPPSFPHINSDFLISTTLQVSQDIIDLLHSILSNFIPQPLGYLHHLMIR